MSGETTIRRVRPARRKPTPLVYGPGHRMRSASRIQRLTGMRTPVGAVVGVACFLLFLSVADHIFAAGYLGPMQGVVWDTEADAANAGGQWLTQALLALVRAIPRAGPELLVLMTIGVVSFMLGMFAQGLNRRGWSVLGAGLAAVLLALHPVTMYLATTGQPAVLGIAAVAVLVVAIDRASALADAQSLMALGLTFALLFVTEPNALYLLLPVLAVLPLTLREMRDTGSTAALLLIVVTPSVVVVGTLLVGSMIVGIEPETILLHWVAVLHGSLDPDALSSGWLARNGGSFFVPVVEIAGLCFGCLPIVLLAMWRLLLGRWITPARVPVRTGTALLAIGLAPAAGAFAVLFWHPETRWNAVGTAIAAGTAWTVTASLRLPERVIWVFLLGLGFAFAWFSPYLWEDPDKIAWQSALFGIATPL